jgi:hypothetical protein
MPPKLLLEPSLRVCKFIFSFLEIQNGDLACSFCTLPPAAILARSDLWNLEQIPGWVRITQSVVAWKGILRQVKSNLSQANVKTPFDAWCADIGVAGGNKVTERQALIQLTGENEDSSIAAIKIFASFELMVTEYHEEKMRLGKLLSDVNKNYLNQSRSNQSRSNQRITK